MAKGGNPGEMGATPAPFQLFALRYATHSGRTQSENALNGDPHEAGADLDYYIWLARREGEVFVIDTGFGAPAAEARKRKLLRNPVEALRLIGVEAADVAQVILTHLHYDHAGCLGDFPKAQFHLQVAEAGYATGPCICDAHARKPFDVENIVNYVRSLYDGRIRFHDGDSELVPGLWLHAIPGHSAGLQAVRVYTARGWVVLASDATHFYANIGQGTAFPVLLDQAALLRGYSRLIELAPNHDHIVPGHDPAVMRAYPAVSADLSGIAVRLDVPPLLTWQELAR